MSKQSTILDKSGEPFTYSNGDIDAAAREAFVSLDAVTVSQMLASTEQPARTRFDIYQSYNYMMSDPIIFTALNLHITQSLGAHETTSEVFFLEAKATATAKQKGIIEELKRTVIPQINDAAYQLAYTATGFGDAYARVYSSKQNGVEKIDVNDFLLPPLVQPMVQAGRDVGYTVAFEGSQFKSLTNSQIARLPMPRMSYVPQQRMLYNSWRNNLIDDDYRTHPPLPATIGGSFLQNAERPFFLLQNALVGMSSSRIADAIRETMVAVNMEGMTKTQQQGYYNSIVKMFSESKRRAERAIKEGKPITEKFVHIIPTQSEKQMMTIDNSSMSGSGSASGYGIDDVMFYAKMLAAVLGHDLSMLGFADILSGGLGDGGFYRVSAQGAQRAIMIRQGFTRFVNHIVDIHMNQKYGGTWTERPYEVTFVGAQSALENERQDTQERRAMASATTLQTFAQMKEVGFTEVEMANFMRRQMSMDEEDSNMYAKALHKAPAPDMGGMGDENNFGNEE